MRRPMLLLTCSLVLAACGDDNGGSPIDCQASCQQVVACEPTESLPECLDRCAAFQSVLTADVLASMDACVDRGCDQLNACIDATLASCGGDISEFVDTACDKQVSCSAGTITVDECRAALYGNGEMDVLRCLNRASIAQLATCLAGAQCATLDADFETCAQQVLGPIASDDGPPT